MEWLQIANLLHGFGADVLITGAAVYGLTLLLKKTALKKMPKKFITFLPFALGILLYAAFSMLIECSASQPFTHPQTTVQNGIASGSCATVIHVVYEQFIRPNGGKSESAKISLVRELTAGYDLSESAIANIAGVTGENAQADVENILGDALGPACEREKKQLAFLLANTLKYLS